MDLHPGDIVCTRGNAWLSRLIRFFTRALGEGRTRVNHVGVLVEGGPLARAVIVEARSTVQRNQLYEAYQPSTGQEIAIFRCVGVSAESLAKVVQAAEEYVGRKYGYLKLVAHFIDWSLGGIYLARRLACLDDYPICSWLVAHAYLAADVTFGVPAGAATPDDIWDECVGDPTRFIVVHPLGPLPEQP